MICRIWHGWTTPEDADAYEHLLRSEIFAGIVKRGIPGFQGIELLRRPGEHLVEFVTLMWFNSLEAVRAFAGADYEVAVVPPAARALLQRFDARSAHYEVRQPRRAGKSGAISPELNEFAERYARAWCSQNPESVASFFAEEASLRVNDGAPAVGRRAIAAVARDFMTAFPDMVVTMDELIRGPDAVEFHWTLTGTNTGPGGTGKRVRISGHEEWQFETGGLLAASRGHFDADEYARQLQHGVDG
jgi:heme-degrading monooxygenase HmoA